MVEYVSLNNKFIYWKFIYSHIEVTESIIIINIVIVFFYD